MVRGPTKRRATKAVEAEPMDTVPAVEAPKRGRKATRAVTPTVDTPKTESRKRGRKPGHNQASQATAKRAKVDATVARDERIAEGGVVLAVGQGDTGQLGLGEDVMERSKPAHVKSLSQVVEVVAGGMHSVAVTHAGEVYTFGCNDEGALGRVTPEDEECFTPQLVKVPGKVIQVSAGDSHTVALTDEGLTYYWGTFRDSSGSFGLTSNGIEKLPIPLAHHLHVKKIASGSDHVALLTQNGEIYTIGCAEQGQLGRVGERFVARGGRRGVDLLLQPDLIHGPNRKIDFTNVWAGSYSTYALTSQGEVWVCGLNNYNQLGVKQGQMFFTLKKSDSFSSVGQTVGLKQITPGQHHALALDQQGLTYAIGRVEYGRLGLGTDRQTDATEPTPIDGLKAQKVVNVSCGTAVSFAVTESGEIFSWGMGTNGQLGHGDESDVWEPKKMLGKQLETRKVFISSSGGQHTVLMAMEK